MPDKDSTNNLMTNAVETAFVNLEKVFSTPLKPCQDVFRDIYRGKMRRAQAGDMDALNDICSLIAVSQETVIATVAPLNWDDVVAFRERDRAEYLKKLLADVPKRVQRCDSTTDQLKDLLVVATHLGMYDAVDAIRRQWHV